MYRVERAGYPAYDAKLLAQRDDIDLHEAIELIRSGCPNAHVLRILL